MNFQMNTFHKFESMKSIILSLCMSRKSSEIWIFNLSSQIGQLIPSTIVGLYLIHLPVGCDPTMHSFLPLSPPG